MNYNYNLFRLARYIRDKKMPTRSEITRGVLGRQIYTNMVDLNAAMHALIDDGLITFDYDTSLRPGPPPKIYWVTSAGREWLKEREKNTNKMLRGEK